MQYTQLNKKGFALSIVLWIVAALLFGAASLALLAKDTQMLSSAINDKLKTELIAEDILEVFKFYEITADYDSRALINRQFTDFKYKFPVKIIADGRIYKLAKDIEISITDTSSMVNSLKSTPDFIAYFSTNKSQRQLFYTIKDSIIDWRDKDNIVSLNGAEASRYELQKSVKFKIRNANAIQSVAELRLINGFNSLSDTRWKQLKKNFYYANGTVPNLSLANEKTLAYLLKMNNSQANSLIQTRKTDLNKFIHEVYFSKSYDDTTMGLSLSKQFLISITATVGLATTRLSSIIDFRGSANLQYETIQTIIE